MAQTYIPIATTTLGTSASSINFSSIPGTYTDLVLRFSGLITSGTDTLAIQVNNDTGNSYSDTFMYANGGSAYASYDNGLTYFLGSPLNATYPTFHTMNFFSYANTGVAKMVLSQGASDKNGSGETRTLAQYWNGSSAITSIQIIAASGASFATGTTATLWGI
jgi:hypothetical protein